MIVDSLRQTPVQQSERTDAEKAGLDYDAFLKLMLQQLKSQDPLNPVDQTENLAQLASFTNVEQAIKMNQKLDALLARVSTAEAASLLGKSVQSLDGRISGTVAAVDVGPQGAFAVFNNGVRLAIGSGMRITST